MLPAQSSQQNQQNSFRFAILVSAVFISGTTQGMLLPLISILLNQSGTGVAMNGLNATALYIGVMIAAPFMEKPTYIYGYKPVLIIGVLLITLSMAFFSIWHGFWIWFILRLIIGIGDNMLHFSAQIWITVTSPPAKKGRNIAFYGLAFGAGFAIGPLLSRLVVYGEALPFLVASTGCLIILTGLFLLKNDFPEAYAPSKKLSAEHTPLNRYRRVITLAWAGLLTTFAYGFLEASLNSNFPVFAVRNGFTLDQISLLLPIFIAGSLLSQIPLGMISDKIGRHHLLMIITLLGTAAFGFAIIYSQFFSALLLIFFLAGMFTGSLFSMGMTFISDLLPNNMLPLGNVLAGIAFSIGSISGPLIGGALINVLPNHGVFVGIAGMMFTLFICCLVTIPRQR